MTPFHRPSSQPTRTPTTQPSRQPSKQPFSKPTVNPSSQPSSTPTSRPSNQPSRQPTNQPTTKPSQVSKPMSNNNVLIYSVVLSTIGIMMIMGIVFYCGLLYEKDHISCETFMCFYMCYDKFGIEEDKDETYYSLCPGINL